MSKGSGRRPSQVSRTQESENWDAAFGPKWIAKDLDGNEIAVGKSYEVVRDKALATTAEDLTFSVLRAR